MRSIPGKITRLETHKLMPWWKQPASSFNTAIMRAATRLGDGWIWGLVAPVVLWMAGWEYGLGIAWRATAVGLFSVLIYKMVKNRFNRPRPFDQQKNLSPLLPPPDKFSFPSGHTMNNTAISIFIGFFLPTLLPILLPLAVLVGFSRVYLRVHYATDVLMGFALGAGIAFLAHLLPVLGRLG